MKDASFDKKKIKHAYMLFEMLFQSEDEQQQYQMFEEMDYLESEHLNIY